MARSPRIGVDVRLKNRRSSPEIGINWWPVGSANSINKTFKSRPNEFSDLAFVLRTLRARQEAGVCTYQLLQSNPALAAASAIGTSIGLRLGSVAE